MKYTKLQLKKDWNFAQELLDRFGLKDFKVTYKPQAIQWSFWHKHLDDHLIKEEFDKIQYFNDRMNIENEDNDLAHQFKKLMPVMTEIYNWINGNKEITKKDYINIFSSFCGSSYIVDKFSDWIMHDHN